MDRRGISPLVGTVVMIVITLLLASMFAAGAAEMADFGRERDQVGDLTDDRGSGGWNDSYRSELIWARDDGPDENTVHVVNYTIAMGADAAGNSLNSVVVEYPDGSASVTEVDEREDIKTVGIDEDRDGDIEVDATDDVECCPPDDGVKVSDGGNTITIELSGNYDLEGGNALIVEFEEVDNPDDAGDYAVTVGINGDETDSGTLEVDDSD